MKYFAIRYDKHGQDICYMHFGPKWWVELFHIQPIVEVELEIISEEEAVEADYYGFYNFKDDGIIPVKEGLGSHPAVYHAKVLLDMHYDGVQAQVDLGRGKVVRVRVTEVKGE